MKSWFDKLNLARKLWLVNATASGTASIFAFIILIGFLWVSERANLQRDTEISAQVIAQNSTPAFLFNDTKAARDVIGALARNKNVIGADIFLPDGKLFAGYRRPANANEIWILGDIYRPDSGVHAVSQFHAWHLDTIVPIKIEGETAGTLLIRIDLEATYQRILHFILVILLTALGAALIGSWLLPRLLRSILEPIGQLVAAMHEISNNGDYSQRAVVKTGDEIGELANSFNFMIEQVERRDEALGQELAERKRAEIQLDYIAHYDSVTGLPNRHFFNRRALELGHLLGQRECSHGLLFVDLDNFKYVNDNFGHRVGDALLVAVAERLRHTLRSNDLVVRLGGDEFAVLLENPKSVDDAVRLANKILLELTEVFNCQNHEFSVSASIGVAMMPEHASAFDELLSCADAAMYEAKARGKNTVQVWQPEMAKRTAQRFTIESGLRKAIENHELEVYYQPIVDLNTGYIAGMEALLRWKHPLLGFIPPAEFIPIAEESRLIVTIGEWVLRQACAQARQWTTRFGPLFLAVNVSGRQFREPGFADSVTKIIEETAYPTNLLELEVTETVIMAQTTETLAILLDLDERGFRLSLDDFGTGYSSLAYLKRFPLSKLKIDRSFVSDLPHDLDDAAIAQAIVALSKNLGMKVVAEGIETTEQADFLHNLDCNYGQGYLYSRPLSADRFEAFVGENLGPRLLRIVGTKPALPVGRP